MSIESWGNGRFVEVRYGDGLIAFFQGMQAALVLSALECYGTEFVYKMCREHAGDSATNGLHVLN